jgi:hypothetical protein
VLSSAASPHASLPASSVVRLPQMGGAWRAVALRKSRTVNCLTLGWRKICTLFRQSQRDAEGKQMRAWMGIAVVVAIGLIWSVAAMSKLVPWKVRK